MLLMPQPRGSGERGCGGGAGPYRGFGPREVPSLYRIEKIKGWTMFGMYRL